MSAIKEAFLNGTLYTTRIEPTMTKKTDVPKARWSKPVEIKAVFKLSDDSVVAICADGNNRVCRVSYASSALNMRLSTEDVFKRLTNRVGQTVRFCSAFGYSPDQWFVKLEAV